MRGKEVGPEDREHLPRFRQGGAAAGGGAVMGRQGGASLEL